MRRLGTAAVATTALLALAGCSGGSGSSSTSGDYCASIKDAKASFGSLSAGRATPKTITAMRAKLEELGGLAPDSVAADYKKLTGGFDDLDKVLGSVGLSIGDFGDQQKLAAAMAKAGPQQLQALQNVGKSFGGSGFQAANDAIRKEVKADCNVSFGG